MLVVTFKRLMSFSSEGVPDGIAIWKIKKGKVIVIKERETKDLPSKVQLKKGNSIWGISGLTSDNPTKYSYQRIQVFSVLFLSFKVHW